VSRYFFSVRWPDRVYGDMLGTSLTDDAAALAHAIDIIRELKQGSEYNDPRTMMIVKNEKLKNDTITAILCGLRLMLRCDSSR
jgi:hypothetical protein